MCRQGGHRQHQHAERSLSYTTPHMEKVFLVPHPLLTSLVMNWYKDMRALELSCRERTHEAINVLLWFQLFLPLTAQETRA